VIQVSDDLTFALENDYFSYVFRVGEADLLEHVYYGAPISGPLNIKPHHLRTQREVASNFEDKPYLSLNDLPQEYPTYGRSDYRQPAFHGRNKDGNSVFSLYYKSHKLHKNKALLETLPSARGGECEQLIITLEDPLYGLEVDLSYTIYEDFGVLARSVHFRNKSQAPIELQNVYSASFDFPADDYDVLHLHGTWSRELNEERIAVPAGRFVIESTRGTSSAAHSPFVALMEKGAGEDHGCVYAGTLIYSGNFAFTIEKGEFEDVRLMIGMNPFNFRWILNPGESFETPEALSVFSNQGLRGMSHIWHNFVRDKISPPQFRLKPRPTYLNTWEADYFDVNQDKVLALADKAKEIGVDMLVLDDGWFEGRRDDTSSLGDWTADKARFSKGIPWLAKRVKSKGLKFGLWFEPEMVNPNSQFYKDHPDWILHVPGRIPSLGRNQLTLDMSRADVRAHIFEKLDTILSCGDIDYVKWDMNRNMTEIGSSTLPPEQQGEIIHRYMLGLYDLLGKLTSKYPDILFENCASGGNRFDLGMLSYMPQTWTSDMCDPIGRLSIIHGASYLFPTDVLVAYVGPSPNHQNGRISSLKTRFMAGIFCAARGLSLNEYDLDHDKAALQDYMAKAKKTAPDMVGGQFDRVMKTSNEVCWQYTTRDKTKIYLAYFHILAAPNLPTRRARLVGLDSDAEYILQEDSSPYRGDELMLHGLVLPYVTVNQVGHDVRYMDKGDFSSYLFEFSKISFG